MASKSRKRPRAPQQVSNVDVQETQMHYPDQDTGNMPTTARTGERKMPGLTAEQITALLGKTRTKGDYIVKLNEFLASGEAGICVNDQWVEMQDKKHGTLVQGFKSAIGNKEAADGADKVKVVVDGEKEHEKVYLINLAAAGVEAEEEVAA